MINMLFYFKAKIKVNSSNIDQLGSKQILNLKGGALKGSARKKTTSLDGVLSNMRRHKIIEDNMEEPEKKEAS